jgi:8-oxo-dGTP diphosphatase
MSNTRTRVVAALISRENLFLACQRPLDKHHGGLWEFPGGKCLPNESDSEAIARELQEELNVTAERVGPPLFVKADPGSAFEIVFLPVDIAGTPRCLEHIELAWLPLCELPDLPLAPTDRLFVEFLLRAL